MHNAHNVYIHYMMCIYTLYDVYIYTHYMMEYYSAIKIMKFCPLQQHGWITRAFS